MRTNDVRLLERVAEKYFAGGTKDFLIVEQEESETKTERKMNELRVKQVQPSRRIHAGCSAAGRCNECSDKIWLEIKHLSMPRNEHGLRVIDHGKHSLVADHPWRVKGYSQLAALGNSRDERK